MARSLILSPSFDVGEAVIGLPEQELALVAGEIQAGTPYRFDAKEVARVTALHGSARSTTTFQLVMDILRWLLPPALFLIACVWVLLRK